MKYYIILSVNKN